VWFGIGMMGLIGWAVAVPTLIGAGLGVWLDERHSSHSWTLALLVAGLVIGCLNAGRWVVSENHKIREETEDRDD
jgi:ATP synthase protein I